MCLKRLNFGQNTLKTGVIPVLRISPPYYEYGFGVVVDLQKAAALYEMGLELASDYWRRYYIQAFYGMCLVRGRGVKTNVEKGGLLFAALFNQTKIVDGSYKKNAIATDME